MWPEPPYLAAVADRDRILLATIRTPPYNLVLSEIDDEAFLAPIMPDLAADSAGANLPGVLGPDPGVEAFARAWSARTGRPHRRSMGERIFRLEHVRPVARPAGAMRPAAETDRPLLAAWLTAFAREAVPDEPPPEPARCTRRRRSETAATRRRSSPT